MLSGSRLSKMLVLIFCCLGVSAPAAWGSSMVGAGTMNSARIGHTATLLQNGKVLVAGGQSLSNALRLCEIYDPVAGTWSPTGSMASFHVGHTATLLADGKVLVVGGQSSQSSVEVYDPETGVWTQKLNIPTGRAGGHTATLLLNGHVLVIGGDGGSGSINAVEEYNPANNTWSARTAIPTARRFHTATWMGGSAVLVAGGRDGSNTVVATVDQFDNALNTWSNPGAVGAMNTAREGHTATRLPSGKVMVAGGRNGVTFFNTVEVYTPAATWTLVTPAAMSVQRAYHTATLMPSGDVLLAGGKNTVVCGDVDRFVLAAPPANSTIPGETALLAARYDHTATLLADGRVLVTGGRDATNYLASAELIVPTPPVPSSAVTGALNAARHQHTATLLLDGTVLVAGGDGAGGALLSAEVFDLSGPSFTTVASMASARYFHSAALLPSGKVLVTGGVNGITLASGELFTPGGGGAWASAGAAMTAARAQHTSSLLANGTVLLAGGENSGSAEIYNPAASPVFQAIAAPMHDVRFEHTATVLSDGRVLLAGGTNNSVGPLSSAEIFDPYTQVFTPSGSMAAKRYGHTATLLPDGKVLVAGGANNTQNFLASAEIFDPATGTWSNTNNNLADARLYHTATLLSSGRVLIAGGYNASFAQLSSTDIYDPASKTFTAGASIVARREHTASLLPNNKVLLAGGYNGGVTASAELYDMSVSSPSTPVLSAFPPSASVVLGGALQISGSGLQGSSEASGGGSNSSATNYPLVLIHSLVNGQNAYQVSTADFAATPAPTVTVGKVSGVMPGPALVSVIVNAVPSLPQMILITNSPASVTVRSGNGQLADVTRSFSNPLQALVANSSNVPVPYVPVTFAVVSGTATFAGSATVLSNSWGVAVSPALTAGTTAGDCTIHASVAGVGTPAAFTVTVRPGTPAFIDVHAGNDQSATVGTAYSTLQARVRDDYNNYVPGVPVAFITRQNQDADGAFSSYTPVTTDSSGIASLPVLTANLVAGTFQVNAFCGVPQPAQFFLTNVADSYSQLMVLLPNERLTPGVAPGKASGGAFSAMAGGQMPVFVYAVDQYYNVAESAAPSVSITSSDANAALPDTVQLANGTQNTQVGLKTAGAGQTVTATDTSDGSLHGASSAFTVNASGFAKLLFILPGETLAQGTSAGKTGTVVPQVAGVSFTATLHAADGFSNPISISDTIHLASNDPQAVLPADFAGVSPAGKALDVTLCSAGTYALGATDLTNPRPMANSSPIQVTHGPVAVLSVDGYPSPNTQGVAGNVSVTAIDAYNNLADDYAGTVRLSASDPASALPADYTFVPGDTGRKALSVTLNTVGTQSITATDTAVSSVTGTQTGIIVSALNAAISTLSPDSGTQNGTGFTLTVTGVNFLPGSTVKWNGSDRPTTYISATQVSASIPASDLAAAGKAAVTVYTPPPGGGTSNALSFYVYSGSSSGLWLVTNTNDSGQGSLRLAMQSARSGDAISFDVSVFDLSTSDAATIINVTSALPPMDAGLVTIDAQDRRVTINGSGAGSSDGFLIRSNGNVLRGMTVIGFPLAGIHISNAASNIIGGDRLQGTGPNGRGMRIAKNGTYGLQISGSSCTGNAASGCWIGLDASGQMAQANLAGVILERGAHGNTIGGATSGERNVISGNVYEGITVSDEGSNDNTLIGNLIGVSATSTASSRGVSSRAADDEAGFTGRLSVGNGSAGVFISKGTQSTQLGGSSSSQSNLVGYNGGNGIEVRTSASKRNASKRNKIKGNQNGGIALFDGSNGGITPPAISKVTKSAASSRGLSSRGLSRMAISGTASGDGDVEVFSDTGKQGGTYVGRATVVGGAWSLEADVSEDENITATFTDASGNTSSFGYFGPASSATSTSDSDGDGVSDAAEAVAGTDPNNANDAPSAGDVPTGLTASVKLNFVKANADSLKLAATVKLPGGYKNDGATAGFSFAGLTSVQTLNAKGSGTTDGVTFKMTVAKSGTTGKLTVSIKNKDLQTALADAGMTNESTAKEGKDVPVDVSLGVNFQGKGTVYSAAPAMLYKAVAGKSGLAKQK